MDCVSIVFFHNANSLKAESLSAVYVYIRAFNTFHYFLYILLNNGWNYSKTIRALKICYLIVDENYTKKKNTYILYSMVRPSPLLHFFYACVCLLTLELFILILNFSYIIIVHIVLYSLYIFEIGFSALALDCEVTFVT